MRQKKSLTLQRHKKNGMLEEQRNIETGLSPIIKWPGGKEKEMKYILPNAPRFERFIEPFVGGGAVFMGMAAEAYYINDFSSELMELYQCIATSDADFFRYAEMMDASWSNTVEFFKSSSQLVDLYVDFRNGLVGKDSLKEHIHAFCKSNEQAILDIIGEEFASLTCVLVKEMEANLFRKMLRMWELEKEKQVLPDKDLSDNMETAIKSAVYIQQISSKKLFINSNF